MKIKKMKLQTKISLMITLVLFVSIFFVLPFEINWIKTLVYGKIETNILNTANLIANTPYIQASLDEKNSDGEIQEYINNLMINLDKIKFIVVADMNGIRYSHPEADKIGKKFQGGDEERVLKKGETYVSKGEGTLGYSFRAFAPVYNDDGVQIGFVSVGTLEENINRSTKVAIYNLSLFLSFGFILGTIGTFFLANSIKKSLLGLEPEEIAKLYSDKAGMLEAISEGILAIDSNENITLVNKAALKIIGLENKCSQEELLGKNIYSFFNNTSLPQILKSGKSEYDRELLINDTIILANRVPIKNKNTIIGAMVTFRDKTEFIHLAEEVTGVKQIVEALRANTHEFINKLHVILGLLHLNEVERAKLYIRDIYDEQDEILNTIIAKIKEPTIAGLVMGKISRAKELAINLEIDEDTCFGNREHKLVSPHALITILGNLLENAFEALSKSEKDEKFVYLKIKEQDKYIEVSIEDNGNGISEENLNKIFEKGYTTKGNSKGVGLDLVNKVVRSLNGQIKVKSEIGVGTCFNIIIPEEDINSD